MSIEQKNIQFYKKPPIDDEARARIYLEKLTRRNDFFLKLIPKRQGPLTPHARKRLEKWFKMYRVYSRLTIIDHALGNAVERERAIHKEAVKRATPKIKAEKSPTKAIMDRAGVNKERKFSDRHSRPPAFLAAQIELLTPEKGRRIICKFPDDRGEIVVRKSTADLIRALQPADYEKGISYKDLSKTLFPNSEDEHAAIRATRVYLLKARQDLARTGLKIVSYSPHGQNRTSYYFLWANDQQPFVGKADK